MTTSNEDLLREVLTGQASVGAKLSGLSDRVTEVGKDAREARDGLNRIEATLLEQNVAERLAELRAEFKASYVELRADGINSYSRLRADVTAARKEIDDRQAVAESRIDALEKYRDQTDGARSLMGWLAKNAPWLLALLITSLGSLGLGKRIVG